MKGNRRGGFRKSQRNGSLAIVLLITGSRAVLHVWDPRHVYVSRQAHQVNSSPLIGAMQMRVISHWLRNIMKPAACVRLPPGVPGNSSPLIGAMQMWVISHWLRNITKPAACVRLPPGVPGNFSPLIGAMQMRVISYWLRNIMESAACVRLPPGVPDKFQSSH
jgi:ABC-type branched-subunit amino acid transport system permease subunit